jgi:hypothetical protein
MATQLAAANAINIRLLKLSTSPPSSDVPHDDKLCGPQDPVATNRFIIILDEKYGDKTWNRHQEGLIFRQIVAELIPSVCVSTRFVSYQDWRDVLRADFYDGSSLRHLVLDYAKRLTINPSQKQMAR